MMYVKALLLSLGLWGGSTCDFNQPSNATCQLNERFSDPCSDHFIHPLTNATIVATIIGVGVSWKSGRKYNRKIEELEEQELAKELAKNAADIEVYRIAQEAKVQEAKAQEAKAQEVSEGESSPVGPQGRKLTYAEKLKLIQNMMSKFKKGPEAFNQDHLRLSAR